MKLLICLGNPGNEYEKTRHNIGFMIADALSKNSFQADKKSKSEISLFSDSSEKILLIKPQTFMNNSGQTASKLINFYKLNPEQDVLLVYDDIDIAFGEIRLRQQGSSGGHRGVESIIIALGNKTIPRIRFGIKNEFAKNYKAENFVLSNFSKEEQKALPKLIKKSCQIINFALEYDFVSAMNKFN